MSNVAARKVGEAKLWETPWEFSSSPTSRWWRLRCFLCHPVLVCHPLCLHCFFFTIHCRVSLKMNCEMKKYIYLYEKYHRLLFSEHPAGFPVYQTSSWHLICPNETHVTEVCCWEKWREIIHSKHLYILYLHLHIFHHRLLRDRLIQLIDKNNCYKKPCIFNLLFATPAKILVFFLCSFHILETT